MLRGGSGLAVAGCRTSQRSCGGTRWTRRWTPGRLMSPSTTCRWPHLHLPSAQNIGPALSTSLLPQLACRQHLHVHVKPVEVMWTPQNIDCKGCKQLTSGAQEFVPKLSDTYCMALLRAQIEDKTPFAKKYAVGEGPLPSIEEAASMYRAASSVLRGAGFEHYEISNYARPGHKCALTRVSGHCMVIVPCVLPLLNTITPVRVHIFKSCIEGTSLHGLECVDSCT